MKVILKQDVDNLGTIGDIVSVKNGYARNFLLPRNLASLASDFNKKSLEIQQKNLVKIKEKNLNEAKSLLSKIEKTSVTISKTVGEDERIFGTVTTQEIADLLDQEGIKLDRRKIEIVDDIKKVGVYTAQVKLHPEVLAKLKVWVVAQ